MRSHVNPKSFGGLRKKTKPNTAFVRRQLVRAKESGLIVRSLTLTPAADATLQRLSTEAAARMGRKVSGSAIVRALLHLSEKKNAVAQLLPLLVRELTSGAVVWGRERKG